VPIPDETVKVTADNCPHCGSQMKKPTRFESRIVEELPEPRQAMVTEYLLAHYVCPNCSKEVIASHPNCPDDGRFGRNLQSHVTLMKFDDRLPYRKIKRALKRQHGIDITAASILELNNRSAKTLRPEYDRIMERIRTAKVVYGDETGMKVNGKKCWIWVFTTDNETIIVVAESRGRKVIERTLGKDFDGILVCDGWKPYTSFTKRIQRCWAHLLREADNLAEHHEEANKISRELHSIFNDCHGMMEEDPPPDKREQIHEAMEARMKQLLNSKHESEQVNAFITKATNGFDYWFTFVLNPEVEPTNNKAERVLREHVVHRKIIGTLRNEKGMFIHETVMSALATWEQNGLNAYDEMMGFLRG
jgi:transposase